jgi:hypothetical protein
MSDTEAGMTTRFRSWPHAIGVDLDFPGYDGTTLPFADESVDTVYSSHMLEHVPDYRATIRDWHRVLEFRGVRPIARETLRQWERAARFYLDAIEQDSDDPANWVELALSRRRGKVWRPNSPFARPPDSAAPRGVDADPRRNPRDSNRPHPDR